MSIYADLATGTYYDEYGDKVELEEGVEYNLVVSMTGPDDVDEFDCGLPTIIPSRWYYIYVDWDCCSDYGEIRNIKEILEYLGDEGYEIMDFRSYFGSRDTVHNNITFMARGRKKLMYKGKPVKFKWHGGDLLDVMIERNKKKKPA